MCVCSSICACKCILVRACLCGHVVLRGLIYTESCSFLVSHQLKKLIFISQFATFPCVCVCVCRGGGGGGGWVWWFVRSLAHGYLSGFNQTLEFPLF